jgi:hypothetical protein
MSRRVAIPIAVRGAVAVVHAERTPEPRELAAMRDVAQDVADLFARRVRYVEAGPLPMRRSRRVLRLRGPRRAPHQSGAAVSLRDLALYVGTCGGVLFLARELGWRARSAIAVARLRGAPPPPFQLPREIARLSYVRHEIACLVCGKRLPQYELDEGLEIGRPSQPERHRPCSPEKASVP